MGRFNQTINSFSSGEVTPKLGSRTDLEQNANGLDEMLNFIPSKAGGAFRRMGSQFINNVSSLDATYSTFPATTLPFKGFDQDYTIFFSLNDEDVRLAAFTSQPIRIFDKDGNEATVFFTDAANYTALYPNFASTLDPDGFRYNENGDEMIVVHTSGSIPPFKIVQTSGLPFSPVFFVVPYYASLGDTSNQNQTFDVVRAMTLRDQNTNFAQFLRPSVTGGGAAGTLQTTPVAATLFAEDGGGVPTPGFFDAGHVGAFFTLEQGAASEGVFYVQTIVAGGASATGVILVSFTNLLQDSRWFEGAWSGFRGYPKALGHFQGRTHYANNFAQPNFLWVSGTDTTNFFLHRVLNQDTAGDVSGIDHSGTHDPSNPFRKGIRSTYFTEIQWLIDDGDLRAGTRTGDFKISFDAQQATGYERDTFQSNLQSGVNAGDAQPYLGDEKVFYISASGKRIRSIDSRSGDFQYRNLDLSILADHMRYAPESSILATESINSSKFRNIYWQESNNTLWSVNTRGTLIGLTVNSASQVTAFHSHQLGGTPTILSVSSVLNQDTNFDELVVLVQRTVNGTDRYYIETIGEEFNHTFLDNTSTDVQDKPSYLDSFLYVNQASSVTVSGLGHLEGEVVSALYNGTEATTLTVTGGAITLPAVATDIIVGYPYTSRLKTQVIEAGQQFGASKGNTSRIDSVLLSLYRTSYGLIGFEDSNLVDIEVTINELATEDVEIEFPQSPDIQPRVIIETDKPLPLNVLGITLRGASYDG